MPGRGPIITGMEISLLGIIDMQSEAIPRDREPVVGCRRAVLDVGAGGGVAAHGEGADCLVADVVVPGDVHHVEGRARVRAVPQEPQHFLVGLQVAEREHVRVEDRVGVEARPGQGDVVADVVELALVEDQGDQRTSVGLPHCEVIHILLTDFDGLCPHLQLFPDPVDFVLVSVDSLHKQVLVVNMHSRCSPGTIVRLHQSQKQPWDKRRRYIDCVVGRIEIGKVTLVPASRDRDFEVRVVGKDRVSGFCMFSTNQPAITPTLFVHER